MHFSVVFPTKYREKNCWDFFVLFLPGFVLSHTQIESNFFCLVPWFDVDAWNGCTYAQTHTKTKLFSLYICARTKSKCTRKPEAHKQKTPSKVLFLLQKNIPIPQNRLYSNWCWNKKTVLVVESIRCLFAFLSRKKISNCGYSVFTSESFFSC